MKDNMRHHLNSDKVEAMLKDNDIQLIKMDGGAWYQLVKEIDVDHRKYEASSYIDFLELPYDVELTIELISFHIQLIDRRLNIMIENDMKIDN